MCLGVWTAALLCLLDRIYNPVLILAVAGVGHLVYLAREKYLPCNDCKLANPIKFTFNAPPEEVSQWR